MCKTERKMLLGATPPIRHREHDMNPISIYTRLGIYAVCAAAIALSFLRMHEYGYNAGVADSNAAIAKANDKAEKAQQKLQEASDAKAAVQNAALDAQIETLSKKIKLIAAYKPVTALPKDCVYDQARIKWANEE